MQLLAKNAPTLFTPALAEDEAARARKLESIYHVGQLKAWDGREVLKEALEKFPVKDGQPRIPLETAQSLARVFTVLMWGELAAWRLAAQLGDMVEDHGLRLGVTAQAHDEARHYYVLHDYLAGLNVDVPPLDSHTRAFLNACLSTRRVLHKVVGMHLFVETIALTIFKRVRDLDVDPALSHILAFYERDEARHVGLGVQALPGLMKKTGPVGRALLLVFEARVLGHMLLALKGLEGDLRHVGVDPRELLEDGWNRFARIVQDYRQAQGVQSGEGKTLVRVYRAAMEWAFPRTAAKGAGARVRAALHAFQHPDAAA